MRKRHGLSTLACGIAALLLTSAHDDNARPAVRGWRRLCALVASMSSRPTAGAIDPAFPYRPYRPGPNDRAERLRLRFVAAAVATDMPAASAEDLRVKGIAELLSGQVEQAVRTLSSAGSLKNDAAIWNALAAAHLERADRDGAADAALDAFVATKCALIADRRSAPAMFNEILAFRRLGLVQEASASARRYRDAKVGIAWVAEIPEELSNDSRAVAKTSSLRDVMRRLNTARDHRAVGTLRDFARESPRLASGWAEQGLLRWADAYSTADRVRADKELVAVRIVAAELKNLTGECMLADEVAAIARSRDREALAVAQQTYWDGLHAQDRGANDAAEKAYRSAVAKFAAAGSPSALSARCALGSLYYLQGRVDDAAAVLDGVLAERPQQRGYRGLAANAYWARGLCFIATGSPSAALPLLNESRQLFADLHQDQLAAALNTLISETLDLIAQPTQAWTHGKSFERLPATNVEPQNIAALLAIAEEQSRRGEWSRALTTLDLATGAAMRLQDPQLVVMALSRRMIVHAKLGRTRESDRDFGQALTWLSQVQPAARIGVDVDLSIARAKSGNSPAKIIADLYPKIGIYALSAPTYVPPLLLERARQHRRQGDLPAARRDLRTAIGMIERYRTGLPDPSKRAAMFSAAEGLAEEAESLAIASGDTSEAFVIEERTRARALLDGLGVPTREVISPMHLSAVQEALASHAAIVVFLRVDGRLRAIVVRHATSTLVEIGNAETIGTLASDLHGAMEDTNRGAAMKSARSLYDSIMRPLGPALASATTVTFVPEATLRGVPFAGLYDALRDRFLIEDITIVEAPSATAAITASQRAGVPADAPMLAIGASTASALVPLPAAEREAKQIATLRPGSLVLTGDRATPLTLAALAPRFPILHIAGHGTAGQTPAQATLGLAPDEAGGSLSAAEVAQLSLPSTRVVVLTGCRTSAPGKHGDGPESLATAFLLAGAPTVIGSAWYLLDDDAARFADRFHQALLRDEDPALALQHALVPRLPNGRPRSPTEWANFSAMGGSRSLIAPTRISMR